MSDLVEFLLERALNNQHIGHFLFWELRADMNKKSSAASLLYGLLLEAYLIAAPEHEIILEHQLTLLEKCKATSLDINKVEIVSRSHQKAKHRYVNVYQMRGKFEMIIHILAEIAGNNNYSL